jgi:hypothetical protein
MCIEKEAALHIYVVFPGLIEISDFVVRDEGATSRSFDLLPVKPHVQFKCLFAKTGIGSVPRKREKL